MITCANCSGNFGAAHNFGFLVQSEIIGADSYHFTLQKSLIGGFEKNYVQIDKFLLEDKYYLVKCVSCGVEVGRKLVVPKDFSYIVFEKEKLLYDSVQVGKDVIWGRLLSQPPFNEFQMFKIEEFKDVKLKTLTKKLPTGKMSGPHAVNQSCVAKQRDSKFGRRNDHTPDNSTKAVRPRVGDSVDEKVKFLKSKRETWDANQLIYEFTTASSASWKDIMSRGFEDDDNGRILHEVFDLLSLQEIRENPNAAALYTPFSQQNGPHAVSTYLMVGDLKESSIEEAVSKGRGGKVWVEVMCSALCAAQTLRYVMDKFVAVRSNTMMSMIMEVFSLRVSALIGEQFAETDTLNGWAPSLSDEDKNKCHSTAKILASIVEAIKRMQKASNDARIQKSDKNATEDAEREKEVARTRHSRGVSFMDDPSRDKDYLIATDMPTPANLLSPPPTSLPENHIESGSSTDSGQFDSDQLSVTPQRPYRDLNHYLNTHFILVLEDCVAQLRRGIKAYREILNGIEFSKLDTHHVERSCVSFVRSRDSGAYMYGDVIIENVEAMRNGIGYVVSFKMFEARKVDWQNSSRFMNGSLLCLSRDGSFSEESMILATVMKGVQTPKGSLKGWTPTITIDIDENSVHRFDTNASYTMMESMVYFDAYRPVLRALQSFGKNGDLPFSDILLGKNKMVDLPSYLREKAEAPLGSKKRKFLVGHSTPASPAEKKGWDFSSVFPGMDLPIWNPVAGDPFPILPADPPLDARQKDAIKQALSKELCLIQGPPGTGKTFVGVLISKILIKNQSLRQKLPVMFICQTNHALDQMLEHIYKFDQNIIRIGGRSESATMQSLGLAEAKNAARTYVTRSEEEKNAFMRKRSGAFAVRSALSQCKAFRSGSNGDVPFANCVLARLYFILLELDPEAASEVAGLVQRSSDSAQKAAWESCSIAASSLKICETWQSSVDGFEEWKSEDVSWKMLKMATYVPDNNAPDVAIHMVDQWKNTAPKKQESNGVDEGSFQVVRSRKKASKTSRGGDDEEDEGRGIDKADSEEEDEEFLLSDPDALVEIASRIIEESDDDEAFNFPRKNKTNEEIVRDLVMRKVTFKITERFKDQLATRNLNSLSTADRKKLIKSWGNLLLLDAKADMNRQIEDYSSAAEIVMRYDAVTDAAILKSASAIGMTTNGAAKYKRILRELHVEVIVVEEAAAILESSIIAALSSSTKHMILIGDHVQLRPKVNEYKIATQHGLEISLFERLIRMGCPYVRLTTQRRMHPEVCELITPSIYKTLSNDPSVSLYPKVSGIGHRVVFIAHEELEDGQNLLRSKSGIGRMISPLAAAGEVDKTKTNSHEAHYLVALLQHLLMQGYKSTQIVVLSMYLGQLMLMKSLVRDAETLSSHVLSVTGQLMSEVRMSTTDNYQGEESDIVLLSLTRSNREGNIGFVKEMNRICVGLSRARHGMYVTGNMSMIEEASPLWRTICNVARSRGTLLDHLPLHCNRHTDYIVKARTPGDFSKCPNGGCKLPCHSKLDCGHTCEMLCHPISHDVIRCIQECMKPRPPGCAHKCKKGCWEDCGPCTVQTKKVRSLCGHTIRTECHVDANDEKCSEPCGYPMICGHSCLDQCSPAGHDALRHRCKEPCNRTPLCGHPCLNKCSEQCGQCTTPVQRLLLCGHSVETLCYIDISTLLCTVQCDKGLPCGHKCVQRCHHLEECGSSCKEKVKKTVLMCRKAPIHWLTVSCDENIDDALCAMPCSSLLPCGHKCLGTCNDCEPVQGDGSPMAHKTCSEPCKKALVCNHKCKGQHLCGDSSRCPPCFEPCAEKCAHRECPLDCGVPCPPCEEQCAYRCPHMICGGLCCQPHFCVLIGGTVVTPFARGEGVDSVCNERCRELLSCGHPCQGFCGEKCPSICVRCRANDDYGVDSRFIELDCGHAFESDFLLTNIMRVGKGTRVPACPTCGETVSGVYRYSSLMRESLRSLEQETLLQLEEQLCREVTADEGPVHPQIEELSEMLVSRPGLKPTILLLIGKLYVQVGSLASARKHLTEALEACPVTIWVRIELLTCLGYLNLSGDSTEDDFPVRVKKSSDLKLAAALAFFNDAQSSCAVESMSRGVFCRTSLSTAEVVAIIGQELIRRRAATRATSLAAEAAKREFIILSSAALPIEQSWHLFPSVAMPQPLFTEVRTTGGTPLHKAASEGNLKKVRSLVDKGEDTVKQDDFGNTALLCAVENRNFVVAAYLAEISPWHVVNKAQRTFLNAVDIVACIGEDNEAAKTILLDLSKKALTDPRADPSHKWAASKHRDNVRCASLDELMDMIGLVSVKRKALELFDSISTDIARPEAARIMAKQAMNFMFLGNPGTGKTTVARVFAKMLGELGIRRGGFEETSGQKLLEGGSSQFSAVLQSVTPGVLFIDEVYQLDPKGGGEGRAITNSLMEAAENDRDKLSVIVAGYRNDVIEKWAASNQGILSRFPYEIVFEDFNEKELRTIFINLVNAARWRIENYVLKTEKHGHDTVVDVALIAARRLSRSAGRAGFANARTVRVMFEGMQRAASERQKREMSAPEDGWVAPEDHSTTLTLIDLIGHPVDLASSPLVLELMSMTGLDDVKRSVRALLEVSVTNYLSELRGEEVLDVSLHRMFLGNPGTGKTTIAGLYGRILVSLGYLTNGEVIVVGASKLMGSTVGSTAKCVNDYMDSVKGKVLVIDEAYVLGTPNSLYGKEALDTIVERVQGTPGENFAVIMCGYEDEMKTMLRDCNPGLKRRFKSDDAFMFADYSDEELAVIMLKRSQVQKVSVTKELAESCVKNVLAKQKAKQHFGNVGAVNNLLESAKEKMMQRENKHKENGLYVLLEEDFFTLQDSAVTAGILSGLMNADNIKAHIARLIQDVKIIKKKNGDPKKLLRNYSFEGSPGTGKTTVARAFGEVFHSLGLLSSPAVVECKAMELMGQYVGHSAKNMSDKMKEALGGVLFIDEAYGLNPSRSVFAKDILEQLLANLTDPKYEGKMLVIIAGYTTDICALLESNAGMISRFKERLEFNDWAPPHCLALLLQLCAGGTDGAELPETLHPHILRSFGELIVRNGWGNARDVNTVYDDMKSSRERRLDDASMDSGPYVQSDMDIFDVMIHRRQKQQGTLPKVKLSSVVDNAMASAECSDSRSVPKQVEVREEAAPVEDSEVEETVYETVIEPEDLWSSLDEALTEMGYDVYTTAIMLKKGKLPEELVALVAAKVSSTADRVRPMLEAQCPALLPAVMALIEKIRKELELQRIAQEEMEIADEIEREILRHKEKSRRQEAVLERVQMIGRCCMGYEWIKVNNGYRCAGKSHFVSDAEVGLV